LIGPRLLESHFGACISDRPSFVRIGNDLFLHNISDILNTLLIQAVRPLPQEEEIQIAETEQPCFHRCAETSDFKGAETVRKFSPFLVLL